MTRTALALASLLTLSACATANGEPPRHTAMIDFYLRRVCLPHLADGVPVEEVARRAGLRRVDHCSIQGCLHHYCSSDGELGCVDLQADYCALALTGDAGFDALDAEVRSVLAADKGGWTPVAPLANKAGYGNAYCNAANSVAVETFGVAPGHAPARLEHFVDGPEYDVHIATRAEPAWCLRQRAGRDGTTGGP